MPNLNLIVAMLNQFFDYRVLCFVTFMAVFVPVQAWGQQCTVTEQMVTKLFHPDPGSYTVWNAVYGEEGRSENFVSAVNRPGFGVLVVGEVREKEFGAPSLVFVEYDRRGRKFFEKTHKIQGLQEILKMLPVGDGYVVLGNVRRKGGMMSPWIGFFDNTLQLTAQKMIKDDGFDLYAKDFTQSIDEKQWAVSVTAVRRVGNDTEEENYKSASIYILDKKGNELSSRAYVLGLNSEILGVAGAEFIGDNSGYIATGYFENSFKKKIGWVLRLNDDASLVWQKEFSRGNAAMIRKVIGYRGRDLIVLGDVVPSNGDPMGSWLMKMAGTDGRPIWQRYYYGETGHHDYRAQGLYMAENGILTVMMSALSKVKSSPEGDAADEAGEKSALSDILIPENMSYVHVLTLTPRGITLTGDSYYYGQGVEISSVVEGASGYRIMTGYTNVPEGEMFREPEEKPPHDSPLKEQGFVDLPDAKMSDATKKGLEMLKNKLKEQERDVQQEKMAAKVDAGQAEESAKKKEEQTILTKKAWVALGEKPDAYKDPCAPQKKKISN